MDTKLIPLTKGQFAIVDSTDYDELMKYRWHLSVVGYAARRGKRDVPTIKGPIIYMHRFLTGITDSKLEVDHLDHDKLNNVRSNLRVCTHADNQKNGLKQKQTNGTYSSGFIGVSWQKSIKRFRAYINHGGKRRNIGSYFTAIDAAYARDAACLESGNAFYRLNFPNLK